MIITGTIIHHKFVVDQAVYDGFRKTFNDNNPLHVDESFATQKGFKERVMYGNILNGFLSYCIGELLPLKNVAILSQNIHFLKPVYLNDKLDLQAEVVDFFESVAMAELKFTFVNQLNEKVAKGSIQIGILK